VFLTTTLTLNLDLTSNINVNFDLIQCNSDFDFILYYNLLLCFIPLEMRVRLICAIKFYLLAYLIPNTNADRDNPDRIILTFNPRP